MKIIISELCLRNHNKDSLGAAFQRINAFRPQFKEIGDGTFEMTIEPNNPEDFARDLNHLAIHGYIFTDFAKIFVNSQGEFQIKDSQPNGEWQAIP